MLTTTSSRNDESSSQINLLLIDNYDSYTFNLLQYFPKNSVTVIRNDQVEWEVLERDILPFFHGVILSPGPGRPDRREDFGLCKDLLSSRYNIPILGVCLGHQGLAHEFGGKVIQAPIAMHGLLSQVERVAHPERPHNGYDILEGVPDIFTVTRYHSLIVDHNTLPSCIEPICTVQGEETLMGIAHRDLPYFGVQFHPESICTDQGAVILDNFRLIASDHQDKSKRVTNMLPEEIRKLSALECPSTTPQLKSNQISFSLEAVKLNATNVCPEALFKTLYRKDPLAYWMDSSRKNQSFGRFSYMGPGTASGTAIIQYSLKRRTLKITRPKVSEVQFEGELEEDNFFDWLEEFYAGLYISSSAITPFDFQGGLVGYFGYEMKAESLPNFSSSVTSQYSDSQFLFADRAIAFDHLNNEVWALGVVRQGNYDADSRSSCSRDAIKDLQGHLGVSPQEFRSWITSLAEALNGPSELTTPSPELMSDLNLWADKDHSAYTSAIQTSQDLIRLGETYEVCLTTQLRANLVPHNRLDLYSTLRKNNPAPFSLLLQFPDVAMCSSSPERFLRIEADRGVSMKPIKGTVKRCSFPEMKKKNPKLSDTHVQSLVEEEDMRRAIDLETDIKQRAENLMIVDLIRNDLTTISVPSSVQVPALMKVESYATVHQLVTTITAQLRPEVGVVQTIRRCFPPGSMTGAPKRRTVQILEELESQPRGLYSGVAGYFSLSGTVDFSVVIRSMVFSGDGLQDLSVGAGGAIVALSDPEEEYKEMWIKSQSTLPSLLEYLGSSPVFLG
ncbi:para-aminobenzoate synthase, (PABA) [Entomophthora muscae]|uniref:Para-aminobenzoate synthase, (PABA) n=1 Tax=Entomophthora muscae TaxID=34485 RepID=A0ACC2U9A0_9FUNG|nr:para-aminobenzoate synthase, (PABA) [Entomophthora muscae]